MAASQKHAARKVEPDKYLLPHLSAIPYMVKTILPELQLCGPGKVLGIHGTIKPK